MYFRISCHCINSLRLSLLRRNPTRGTRIWFLSILLYYYLLFALLYCGVIIGEMFRWDKRRRARNATRTFALASLSHAPDCYWIPSLFITFNNFNTSISKPPPLKSYILCVIVLRDLQCGQLTSGCWLRILPIRGARTMMICKLLLRVEMMGKTQM